MVSLFAGACGEMGNEPPTPLTSAPVTESCSTTLSIDRFKELIIVEPSVVEDARARNDVDGPWSFRHLIEEMTPPGASPSDFVLTWLRSLEETSRINLFDVPSRQRANERLLCPWLKATPENACDAICSSCASRTLDLAKAPFRLIAFANRVDLGTTEDWPNGTGEARLAYALTEGPADDPASRPVPMTLIFEYSQPNDEGRGPRYWAERWHALGAHQAYDDAFLTDLDSLYAEITSRPTNGRASWIRQVRTNEIALDWLWDMREFKLVDGALRLSPPLRTPDPSLNGTEELARFVASNQNDVMLGRHNIPEAFSGGFSRSSNIRWRLPGIDEGTRRLFARETCDGCHRSEASSIDENFHVSPTQRGLARLSPFVNNPDDPRNDVLGRREVFMRGLLCDDATAAPYAPPPAP